MLSIVNDTLIKYIQRVFFPRHALEWEADPVVTARTTVPASWSMIPWTVTMSTSLTASLALAA